MPRPPSRLQRGIPRLARGNASRKGGAVANGETTTNFVVVMLDTLRHAFLGCSGNSWIQTLPILTTSPPARMLMDLAVA